MINQSKPKGITRIEDIYPLTIVAMRYGKFAIIEALPIYICVKSLQEDIAYQEYPHQYMEREWDHINYGIGEDIYEAFLDFKNRLNIKNKDDDNN